MEKKQTVPIRIDKKVADYVKKQGIYGETFSDILHRLLMIHKKKGSKQTATEKRIANKI